jgi:DNA-binding MarR family transcriptional regulator/predicted GNAT family N-acyltransferase
MDIVGRLGALSISIRLSRLAEYFRKEVGLIYKHQQIEFESKWFSVFITLYHKGNASIIEIAGETGLSHPAIIGLVKELEKNKLIKSVKDKSDSRKRIIELTDKGKLLIRKLAPIWHDITISVEQLMKECNSNLILSLMETETLLRKKTFSERVNQLIKEREIEKTEIIAYSPKLKEHFKQLNEEWIKAYFELEPKDKEMLENPDKFIIKNGGCILFAKYNDEIVGTCALLKSGKNEYELAKMAVSSNMQGKGIGEKLLQSAIEMAKELNAKKIFLVSNTRLQAALHLYKKLGFVSVPLTNNDTNYQRVDIKMELTL